jgi:hypothetical protein
LPAVGFGQLAGNPMGARACGHTLAAGMLQDQKSIQQPKRDRWDYKQIHRRDAVGMIAEKGLPALRRWLPSLGHVFCHGGLPDIDAKLEQLTVDPWCSPKGFAMLMSRACECPPLPLAGRRSVVISSASRLGTPARCQRITGIFGSGIAPRPKQLVS